MNRSRLVLFVSVTLGMSACHGQGGPNGNGTGDTAAVVPPAPVSRADTILALTGVASNGGISFRAECETCHELPGDPPGRYPSFETVVPERTDLQLVTATIDGVPSTLGPMRAYGEDFTDQQVADLVAYMRETYAP